MQTQTPLTILEQHGFELMYPLIHRFFFSQQTCTPALHNHKLVESEDAELQIQRAVKFYSRLSTRRRVGSPTLSCSRVNYVQIYPDLWPSVSFWRTYHIYLNRYTIDNYWAQYSIIIIYVKVVAMWISSWQNYIFIPLRQINFI